MEYKEEDYLQLSGIQHFLFCRRQWALIHIEHQWAENEKTVDGEFFHKNAHNTQYRERRGDHLTIRGMYIHSASLELTGQCDIVEFYKSAEGKGFALKGEDGLWQAAPVEYKRGRKKPDRYDEAQVCAQALCLEEMLCSDIPEGYLYYGETRHRVCVIIDEELRKLVKDAVNEMHMLYQRGYTPRVKPGKCCQSCSLYEICMPGLGELKSVSSYVQEMLISES